MSGSVVFNPGAVPLSRPPAALGVYRWKPNGGDPELLPNIRCLSIQYREGADPGAARFRYAVGDPNGDPDDPVRFEQMFPLAASGQGVVYTDDRLMVVAQLDDSSSLIMFDGFVQIPQVDAGGSTEMVTFTCLAALIREWDTPLPGALMRGADAPNTVNDNQTDLPVRFNPDGKANSAGNPFQAGTEPNEYPTFLGPVWPSNMINDTEPNIFLWTLPMAARYLIMRGTTYADNSTSTYIGVGSLDYLDDLLQAVVATSGDAGTIDLNDPSTFTLEDIEVQDVDVTGDPWPVALMRVIEPHGFTMIWILSGDEDGLPKWTFKVIRKDDNTSVKPLRLQVAGTRDNPVTLDPTQTNVAAMTLVRDTSDLANQIIIDARPVLVECSWILAPLFMVATGDAANQALYLATANNDRAADAIKYRRFGLDECGEGHWDFKVGAWSTTAPDISQILLTGANLDLSKQLTILPYVTRRRPALNRLAVQDDDGDNLPAVLHVATDYKGTTPGFWDGKTGTWQKVWSGEWSMLDDRLGIKITSHDPNSFSMGDAPAGAPTPAFPGGHINIVECLDSAAVNAPLFAFMLTCSIYIDQDFNVVSPKRVTSPTQFTVSRRVDKRDQFKREAVSPNSYFFDEEEVDDDGNWFTVDDMKDAQDTADGFRRSRESGALAGSATIPYITTAYSLGDKISGINGRNLSLRSNLGAAQNESPMYPSIVAISWEFEGTQATTIELADRRAEPAPRRGRRPRE